MALRFPARREKLQETSIVGGLILRAGRPYEGKQRRYEELSELAAWLKSAISQAGYSSTNAFVARHAFDKNAIYGLLGASRLLTLQATMAIGKALSEDPPTIERLWIRAKEAMDASIERNQADSGRLVTWADLPRAELGLGDLLEAQSEAVEQLPYNLLGIFPPPLSAIYVRQRVRLGSSISNTHGNESGSNKEDAAKPIPSVADSDTLSIGEALNRHLNVLVVGEPGAGKSTLGNHLSHQLSRIWLRYDSAIQAPVSEPVIPIHVPAAMLCSEGSWAKVLCIAVIRKLAMRLIIEPEPRLFAAPFQGARWLIIVDGLDEIPNHADRTSVIQAISAHSGRDSPYRFLITTRPLPERDMAPLRGRQFATYTVEPFSRSDLTRFSQRWFEAQGVVVATERSEAFLNQIDDCNLAELAMNPLLATIAIIAQTLEPLRPLPASRTELFRRFCGYLAAHSSADYEQQSDSTEQRALLAGDGLRDWMQHNSSALIADLARAQINGATNLISVASKVVRDRLGNATSSPEDSLIRNELVQFLISSGQFVLVGDDVRFLHQSLSEFLGAEAIVAELGDDPAALDRWIDRGLEEASKSLAMFVIVIWGEQDNRSLNAILAAMSNHGQKHLEFAGELLVEVQSSVSEEVYRIVVDRLLELGIGVNSSKAFRAVAQLHKTDYARQKLVEVIESPSGSDSARVDACISLGRAGERNIALDNLQRLRQGAGAGTLVRIARGYRDLVSEWRGIVEELLLSIRDRDTEDPSQVCRAAEFLAENGLTSAGLVLIDRLVEQHGVSDRFASDLVRARLAVGDPEAVSYCVSLTGERYGLSPSTKAAIATELMDAGEAQSALAIANGALASNSLDEDGFWEATRVLLRTGSNPIKQIVEEARATRISDSYDLSLLATELAENDHSEEAIAIAAEIIANPKSYGTAVGRAAGAWLKGAGKDSVSSILAAIEQRDPASPWDLARAARILATEGFPSEVLKIARRVIDDPGADTSDLRDALTAIALSKDESFFEQALSMALTHHLWSSTDKAKLVVGIANEGKGFIIRDMVDQLLYLDSLQYADYKDVAEAWLAADGDSASRSLYSMGCDAAHGRPAWIGNAIATALKNSGFVRLSDDLYLTQLRECDTLELTWFNFAMEDLLAHGRGQETCDALSDRLSRGVDGLTDRKIVAALRAFMESYLSDLPS